MTELNESNIVEVSEEMIDSIDESIAEYKDAIVRLEQYKIVIQHVLIWARD